MARIDEHKITEIRQNVNILDVIASYLPLVKKGNNYFALCPFHQDSHPSMSISQEKQIYKCFVCENGGNVFTFLQEYLNISFIEAVIKAAEFAQIDMSDYQYQKVEKPIDKKKQPLYQQHIEASKVYHYYLQTHAGVAAKEYLTRRHIDDDVINTFKIGYAPPKNILVSLFEKQGYTPIQMVESGLVLEGKTLHDRFSNRLMFPLFDHDGRTVGFSGRIIQDDKNIAKYVNSPESTIFTKGDVLYNYYRVKESVRKAGFVIICEGFMDVIAYYRIGIENVVAIMGTALTKGHIEALKRLTKNIHLCLDGDSAGKVATQKAIDTLLQHGFNVHVIPLEQSDPDEILETKGKDELVAIANNTITTTAFLMEFHLQFTNLNNYESKKEYLKKMADIISNLEDDIDKEYYIDQLQSKTNFSKDIIYSMLTKKTIDVNKEYMNIDIPKKTSVVVDRYLLSEQQLLHYMFLDKNVALKYEIDLGFMYDNDHNTIASYIVDFYRKNMVLEIADFIDLLKNKKLIDKVIDISQMQLPSISKVQVDNSEMKYSMIDDLIINIRNKAIDMEINELKKELENSQDAGLKAKILQKILLVMEKRKL